MDIDGDEDDIIYPISSSTIVKEGAFRGDFCIIFNIFFKLALRSENPQAITAPNSNMNTS